MLRNGLVVVHLCILAVLHAVAVARNITIDDQWGDESTGLVPSFTPTSDWAQGAECPGCQLQPNVSLAFDHTWHDSTYDQVRRPGTPTVILLFNGTAIYTFCIQGNLIPFSATAVVETRMNLTFTLDGEYVGRYQYRPDNVTEGFAYNVPTYVNESLAPLPPGVPHNLTIESTAVHLFDYAIYTMPDEDSTSSSSPSVISPSTQSILGPAGSTSKVSVTPGQGESSSPVSSTIEPSGSTGSSVVNVVQHNMTGAIVGGAVGGSVAGLAIVILLVMMYRKRQRTPVSAYTDNAIPRGGHFEPSRSFAAVGGVDPSYVGVSATMCSIRSDPYSDTPHNPEELAVGPRITASKYRRDVRRSGSGSDGRDQMQGDQGDRTLSSASPSTRRYPVSFGQSASSPRSDGEQRAWFGNFEADVPDVPPPQYTS